MCVEGGWWVVAGGVRNEFRVGRLDIWCWSIKFAIGEYGYGYGYCVCWREGEVMLVWRW